MEHYANLKDAWLKSRALGFLANYAKNHEGETCNSLFDPKRTLVETLLTQREELATIKAQGDVLSRHV